ncbi:MAG: adenosylmethionine--8-amino-7-oxononanoate transaminase [Synechococcaceae bacterium WBA_2_066]|nr:adenosylmethionine--8-amino-7-oxononanoate transaminase [Synechococcaceae bacterium WB6_1A_059]NBP32551.1 adenosylmethionine--8-amino-7-oxononanoate transaminase [Synechococcaceae bacterium WB6_1B_055]NBQ18358.1 adenosylmethionine--8-amino-7-oxononanoate transaminase [Synechococcaceae bacterium WB5_2A_257]NBY58919.1 adenosylmethionine--8-amino-7-oxononanoate transaminase [Synechococcaceae bacterium LLD_019]NCU90960.1 adenosylmethionine--8-amino-7-oxononanoate transaminase [Synechococcaceae b
MAWHPHLWHPTSQVVTSPEPLQVRSAKGCLLQLNDGRELIDAISSWWVTLHGHGEPTIASAIARQAQVLEQVIFANFSHEPAEQLATRLSALTGLQRLFFSDNGSTAVEVALKIAWQWWRNQGSDRHQLIAFEGAYHGDTFGAMALGDRSIFTAAYQPLLFDVARIAWPHSYWHNHSVEEREQQALKQLELALETPTAAVILEPLIQGASGMRVVRPAFLQAVAERVQAAGALLIADEVFTGFGRTGALFACQKACIQPDLMALSKGLTGGFLPMGATMASERLYQGFISEKPVDTFFHGHSFTANPLGCAAALASLDLLQFSPERFEDFEQRHIPLLEQLSLLSQVKRPRCLGTMAAFELNAGENSYLNPIGKQIQRHCLEQGVYIRPLGNVVYILPPLCITNSELEKCYSAIELAIIQLC